jgi:xanthine/CO dehydrogenase XdhC/CoxF family maturation factor
MIERRQIVDLAGRGEAGVLVTLVRAEGSSYRRPGARLLTRGGGPGGEAYAGTISGGCLETEVVKKAAWKVRGGPVVEQYSTLFDDTADVPYGLGCGGVVDLLFEASGTPEFEALLHALEASLNGVTATVITWLPDELNRFGRAIVSATGAVVFASAGMGHAEIRAALAAQPLERSGLPRTFVEHLEPPQRLIVLGAGDDARPLVSMAALLGWSVVVADGRAQLARPERFPEAQRVLAASAGQIAALEVTSSDAVVLMTHSYEQDRDWLAAVLPIAPKYFGALGARHRSSLLVAEAAAISGLPLATCCERIFAPVGLDLGGDGPEAIALAVISEAHARCMGRLGASLRLSAADVAAQIERGGPSRYLQMHCSLDAADAAAVVEAAG